MKRTDNFRDLLGLKQEEMASVLNISRSQWSMFELGERDLPLHAKQLLADMLRHLKSANETAKPAPHVLQQQTEAQLHLKQLIREHEFNQQRMQRKISAAEKKYEASQKVLHLADFFESRPENKGIPGHPLIKSVAGKASQVLKDEGLAYLISQQLRLDLLAFEKMLLESKLSKLTRSGISKEN